MPTLFGTNSAGDHVQGSYYRKPMAESDRAWMVFRQYRPGEGSIRLMAGSPNAQAREEIVMPSWHGE